MPANLVNLDALVLREDFEVASDEIATAGQLVQTLSVSELEDGTLWSAMLRKPDFQRETADWDPEKVAGLVRSFLEGDLIPSVILWRSQSSGNVFVIDGAHRLSALKAWVLDDYGDKQSSIEFFADLIPEEQRGAAEKTRKLIQDQIGSYQSLKTALRNPGVGAPERLRLAKNLGVNAIHLEWVTGEAAKAEKSFFTINQKAAFIDATELEMLQARRKPNALATRAFIRAGTGHKYWSSFTPTVQAEIEKIAREVYEGLFRPTLETPIKTTDLPVAGRGYSAGSVKMVFELVNFLNGPRPDGGREVRKGRRAEPIESVPDDQDGSETIRYMQTVRKAAQLISGQAPGSLGLSPIVYFYSATGRFQPTAYLAAIAFARELQDRKRLDEFTSSRERFEEFLVRHKSYINQVVRKYGSLRRGLGALLNLYRLVLSGISADHSDSEIIRALTGDPQLQFLSDQEEPKTKRQDFSGETKSAAYLRKAIESALRCNICHARLHGKSITIDHDRPKEEGGLGNLENAQLTHPYCNTGFKERERSRRKAEVR